MSCTMKAPKNVLEKPSKDTNEEIVKVSPCKFYLLLLTIEACGMLLFGYQLIYGVKEMDRSLQGLSSEQKNRCAVDWIFVWDFFLAAFVLFTPRFDFTNFHNMYRSGGRFVYIMRLILTSVVSFGWLSLVVSRIYQSQFALFAKDAVKMSETHADVCKAILALYFIKIHIIPQFYYLICTLGSKQHASNIKQETPEETNKQSELCDDYSDDQLPKYSSLSLA